MYSVTDIMPLCFCDSHGCSSAGGTDPVSHKPQGKNVDTRTFKAHSVADRQAAFHAAEKNIETTKSLLIFQQVCLQMKFLDHHVALAAPFGRDTMILKVPYHMTSPLLPKNKRTLSYQHSHWPPITLILLLCILQLAKQAQGALEKMTFSISG